MQVALSLGSNALAKAWFAAGTKLQTPGGLKAIEEFAVGDLVLSRDEYDPCGPVEAKRVEEIFRNFAPIWHLHLGEAVVRTTGEHPFFVESTGWTKACDLRIGDRVATRAGGWIQIVDLLDTGEWEPVYNVRVADFHTYFVGEEGWNFTLWSHNSMCSAAEAEAAGLALNGRSIGSQIHHIASDKSGKYLAAFTDLFGQAGLTLQSAFNRTRVLGHFGPHGDFYNGYILKRLTNAVSNSTGSDYKTKLLDELWQLRRKIQNGDLGDLLRAAGIL